MDEVETEFLQSQRFKALVWWKYIDNTFIIWTHSEKVFASVEKTILNPILSLFLKVIETLLTSLTSI